MRSFILLGLAVIALAAPKPSNNGYWDVLYSGESAANGYQAHDVNSTYYNKKLPGGKPVNVICNYKSIPGNPPTVTSSCSDKTFQYSYDGENISLQQTVKLSGKKTVVSGSGPIDVEPYGVGRTYKGEANVTVSKTVPA